MDRWGAYFKPAGMMNTAAPSRNSDDDAPAPKAVVQSRPAPVAKAEDDDPPFDVDGDDTPAPTAPVQAAKPASQRAEDILAMIRNRQK